MENECAERCETCKFWQDAEPGVPPTNEPIFSLAMREANPDLPDCGRLTKYGHCRRYPPDPCVPEDRVGRPVTNFDDWCGEWKAKDEKVGEDCPVDPAALVASLDPVAISTKLDEMERVREALLVLLRAARRGKTKQGAPPDPA